MLDLPSGVSPGLARQLQEIQDQILVLIRNHQILSKRSEADPEDAFLQQQIFAVEKYLVQFNGKQQPIIAQIRNEIRVIRTIKTESPDDGQGQGQLLGQLQRQLEGQLNDQPDDDEDCEDMEDDEEGTSKEATEKENSSAEDDDKKENVQQLEKLPALQKKLSMSDRMALVRQRKRKRKRGTNGRGAAGSGGCTPVEKEREIRTPTPPKQPQQPAQEEAAGPVEEAEEAEGGYRGHVTEVEKKSYDPSLLDQMSEADPENPIQPTENDFDASDQRNFMLHLDLLTDQDVKTLDSYMSEIRTRKVEYRNLTYVPELPEKKPQRATYCWLSADLLSPPLLRTRGRNQLASLDQRPSRKRKASEASASNSRASTPLEDGEEEEYEEGDEEEETDKEEGQEVMEEAEEGGETVAEAKPKRDRAMTEKQREKTLRNKFAAERQMERLEARRQELEAAMGGSGGNRFTVATRKERTRRNELAQEKADVETKLAKLAGVIALCDEQL